MTGGHRAGKDQLYGSSLLLSPISFEDRVKRGCADYWKAM
jgi:hypothetical protein